MIWKGSPNYDTNRKPIKQVVIHWFGIGKLAGVDATFKKPGGTSAHYAVEDNTVHQYVKEEHVAYAVGVYSRNQETISIEHSAEPNRLASDATYQTSGKLIGEICRRHNIPIDRQHIIKHSEVKATQCPGTMDLDRLINIAKGVVQVGPGYPPTFEGQDVTKDGVHYKAIKDVSGNLVWKVEPASPPVDYKKKYEEKVAELVGRDKIISDLQTKIVKAREILT